MSQSASLYRISQDFFKELIKSTKKERFDIATIAKSYSVFQGSFFALEFILAKGQDEMAIIEIFNPNNSISNKETANLTMEEYFELFESGTYIQYHDLNSVSRIFAILDTLSESEVGSKYNAKELNENNVYPAIWHNDNSQGLVYNKSQILEDFTELKEIFKLANKDKDYILVFSG